MRESTANTAILRAFGYIALVAATGCFLLFLANLRARLQFGASNFSYLGYIGAYAAIAGSGTVRLTKWGAVLLTLPVCAAGLVLCVLAIRHDQSFATATLGFAWLVLLSVPAAFCFRSWGELN